MNMQFCAPPNYASAFGYAHGQGPTMQYPEGQYSVHPGYHLPYMYGYQQPRSHMMADRNGLGDGKAESKPRLSKEEVEKLEKVFQENPKPSSAVKAQLADGLGLERPRINNWFQNRRAKAKQERKQEEYEARRAAEKTSSEPNSPGEDNASRSPEYFGENTPRRVQPGSSALFPDLGSASHGNDSSCDDQDEDEAADGHGDIGSSFVEPSKPQTSELTNDFQSPLSLDFSGSDVAVFSHEQSQDYAQSRSMSNYTPFLSTQNSAEHYGHDQQSATFPDTLSSPRNHNVPCEQSSVHQYSDMLGTGFSNPAATMFLAQSSTGVSEMVHSPEEGVVHDGLVHSAQRSDHSTHLGTHGMPTPTDSFKSPPPPANIASRRNIPRPAALQAASLRHRSYNLGCVPKTAMDGSKRVDPSSPAAAMRRISSGNIPGRIQKSSIGPRSPMIFSGRNAEALLQYHARSPVGASTATFPGAAPPTPMTPAVIDQQSLREPTVSSTCSDDGSLMLGGVVSPNMMQEIKTESNLKTPPSTPGLMTNFAAQNFNVNPFSAGVDFSADQPIFTPFYNEFPDLSLRNVPSYAELSDGSMPATPMYPNMVSSIHEHSSFGNTMGNTQYDWDANESVISPKSSPGQPRSKQIQFTQNMTPQDYNSTHQEK
ncbi:hypothetical protein F4775DRAFT_600217 [Biscogniauxia sp. FL1348]|nr:hypothetical protein F4775DRAFT_600217 [Biscogniauxia sp. FL1348]